MKFTNKLVDEIGSSTILHNIIGGLLCSFLIILLTTAGLDWFMAWFIGFCFVTVISFIKERFLDDVPNWFDVVAADLGCGYPLMAYLLGLLF